MGKQSNDKVLIRLAILFLLAASSIGSQAFALDGDYGDNLSPAESTVVDSPSRIKQSHKLLLNKLAIAQGKGNFKQEKHFKFLSQPIVSDGQFIVKENAVLWETLTPVFTQLLVQEGIIYNRQSKQQPYSPMIESDEFSALFSTIFSGKVNSEHWQLASQEDNPNQCLVLKPTQTRLQQIFQKLILCINDAHQREILLLDNNNNKTEIFMQLENTELSETDKQRLIPH